MRLKIPNQACWCSSLQINLQIRFLIMISKWSNYVQMFASNINRSACLCVNTHSPLTRCLCQHHWKTELPIAVAGGRGGQKQRRRVFFPSSPRSLCTCACVYVCVCVCACVCMCVWFGVVGGKAAVYSKFRPLPTAAGLISKHLIAALREVKPWETGSYPFPGLGLASPPEAC